MTSKDQLSNVSLTELIAMLRKPGHVYVDALLTGHDPQMIQVVKSDLILWAEIMLEEQPDLTMAFMPLHTGEKFPGFYVTYA